MAYHGMPVAHLLGVPGCEKSLTTVVSAEPKILPDTLCYFGIRSYEDGERLLLESLNVRIYYMEEIRERGVEVCWREAIKIVQGGDDTVGFGLSFDIDAIDPVACPGVGSPEPGGLWPEEMLPLIARLKDNKKFLGMEITEFNPTRDVDNKSLHLVESILEHVLLL
jgi:arginase